MPSEITSISEIILYSDGASRGNPGKSSAGFILYDGQKKNLILRQGTYLGNKTNNQAEYTALYLGIRRAREYDPKRITCYLDSELVTKQMRGEYKIKNPEMQRLYEIVKNESTGIQVTFEHVLRHLNKEADKIANYALDKGREVGDTFLFRS